MRYNKHELIALASQMLETFDYEGVFILKERQDGFFRRSEGSSFRLFRLWGNLLFYLNGPEPWREPVGAIVLGNHKVTVYSQDEDGHWPFQIDWDTGVSHRMATLHECERTLWLNAIESATYEKMTQRIADLTRQLNDTRAIVDLHTYRVTNKIVSDLNEVPLCEVSLACDNLLCDSHGRPPSSFACAYVLLPAKGLCVRYCSTEVVTRTPNPVFSRTMMFRGSDGLLSDVMIRFVVYDVRELVTHTGVALGSIAVRLDYMQEAQRIRVPLTNQDKTVGFLTINCWSSDPSPSTAVSLNAITEQNSIDPISKIVGHRRTQSLPSNLCLKMRQPVHCALVRESFVNPIVATYRFETWLGGEVTVHETLAEPRYAITVPLQLIDIYMKREREQLETLLAYADLNPTCNDANLASTHLQLTESHLVVHKIYMSARDAMMRHKTSFFKSSADKWDTNLAFIPINMHLQRMWAHNDTLNKSSYHDVITVGAFTAHFLKHTTPSGLISLLQLSKEDVTSDKAEMMANTNRLEAELEKLFVLKAARDELVFALENALLHVHGGRLADLSHLLGVLEASAERYVTQWNATAIADAFSDIGWDKSQIDAEHDTLTMMNGLPVLNAATVTAMAAEGGSLATSLSRAGALTRGSSLGSALSLPAPMVTPGVLSVLDAALSAPHAPIAAFIVPPSFVRVLGLDINAPGNYITKDKKNCFALSPDPPPSLVDTQKVRQYNHMFFRDIATAMRNLTAKVVVHIKDIHKSAACTDKAYEECHVEASLLATLVDEASRWARMAHTAMRLHSEEPSWSQNLAMLQLRRDVCFSQALSAVTAGLTCWLASTPREVVHAIISSGLGPLCGFEGMLSLFGPERYMWGDMVVAIEDLQTLTFRLVSLSARDGISAPLVLGRRNALVVELPVSDELYALFNSPAVNPTFTITAVFFNIGINEKASMAEALYNCKPQNQSNADNLNRLTQYCSNYGKFVPNAQLQPDGGSSRRSRGWRSLQEVLSVLRAVIERSGHKDVAVLQLAAEATRIVHGVRFTSCKSAKDRTGMSVTLEQTDILKHEYHLTDSNREKSLNVMRREGCRRENTTKNIGVNKYAFNKRQVMSLPIDYRPPPGTYGSVLT